jgi:hypothetical protein
MNLRIHPIPRCWTLWNQFRPRNQFHLIPGIPFITFNTIPEFRLSLPIQFRNSRNQFLPIPRNSRNSVRFRNWVIIMLPSLSHPGYCIQFLNGIPGIDSSRNWTEFRAIPWNSYRFRNWVIIMSPSSSHPGYCVQFLNGIPGIESSRNRTESRSIPELSDHHAILNLTPWLLHPIPERNSGNWVERKLDGIPCNSYRFRNRTELGFEPIPEFQELVELIPESDGIQVWPNSGIPGIDS